MSPTARRLPFLGGLINLYLLETKRGPVLVDTGAPGMFRWVLAQLRRAGLRAQDLGGVVLSHFHVDHAGTAAAFLRRGVPVYAHRDELPVLHGHQAHPGYGRGRGGRVLRRLEAAVGLDVRLPAVQPLEPGEPLFGSPWRVLSAPGHSPGSLALWHPERGELLSGDTLVTTFGRPRGPVPLFTPDLPTARQSAAELLALEPRRIWPGHGPPVGVGAFERLRHVLRPADIHKEHPHGSDHQGLHQAR